eukprot:TRINITY_DN908_c1_g1_i5.p1 TRINITY_DN908_c1_g1~~TRINITY_DN908_c1_g1_i5.p1  ORF type:complete len:1024 (+),score=347.45 TRINITY_DN908_c1_g1_i5:535-3606(+)
MPSVGSIPGYPSGGFGPSGGGFGPSGGGFGPSAGGEQAAAVTALPASPRPALADARGRTGAASTASLLSSPRMVAVATTTSTNAIVSPINVAQLRTASFPDFETALANHMEERKRERGRGPDPVTGRRRRRRKRRELQSVGPSTEGCSDTEAPHGEADVAATRRGSGYDSAGSRGRQGRRRGRHRRSTAESAVLRRASLSRNAFGGSGSTATGDISDTGGGDGSRPALAGPGGSSSTSLRRDESGAIASDQGALTSFMCEFAFFLIPVLDPRVPLLRERARHDAQSTKVRARERLVEFPVMHDSLRYAEGTAQRLYDFFTVLMLAMFVGTAIAVPFLYEVDVPNACSRPANTADVAEQVRRGVRILALSAGMCMIGVGLWITRRVYGVRYGQVVWRHARLTWTTRPQFTVAALVCAISATITYKWLFLSVVLGIAALLPLVDIAMLFMRRTWGVRLVVAGLILDHMVLWVREQFDAVSCRFVLAPKTLSEQIVHNVTSSFLLVYCFAAARVFLVKFVHPRSPIAMHPWNPHFSEYVAQYRGTLVAQTETDDGDGWPGTGHGPHSGGDGTSGDGGDASGGGGGHRSSVPVLPVLDGSDDGRQVSATPAGSTISGGEKTMALMERQDRQQDRQDRELERQVGWSVESSAHASQQQQQQQQQQPFGDECDVDALEEFELYDVFYGRHESRVVCVGSIAHSEVPGMQIDGAWRVSAKRFKMLDRIITVLAVLIIPAVICMLISGFGVLFVQVEHENVCFRHNHNRWAEIFWLVFSNMTALIVGAAIVLLILSWAVVAEKPIPTIFRYTVYSYKRWPSFFVASILSSVLPLFTAYPFSLIYPCGLLMPFFDVVLATVPRTGPLHRALQGAIVSLCILHSIYFVLTAVRAPLDCDFVLSNAGTLARAAYQLASASAGIWSFQLVAILAPKILEPDRLAIPFKIEPGSAYENVWFTWAALERKLRGGGGGKFRSRRSTVNAAGTSVISRDDSGAASDNTSSNWAAQRRGGPPVAMPPAEPPSLITVDDVV